MTDSPLIFDVTALRDSLPPGMGTNSPLARRLILLFAGEAGSLIDKINQASATNDLKSLFQAAHALKSSSASLGAIEISRLAAELEMHSGTGAVDSSDGYPERLRSAFERFCAESEIRDLLM